MVIILTMGYGPYRNAPQYIYVWERSPEALFCWCLWFTILLVGLPGFLGGAFTPMLVFLGIAVAILGIWIRDGVTEAPFRRGRKFH